LHQSSTSGVASYIRAKRCPANGSQLPEIVGGGCHLGDWTFSVEETHSALMDLRSPGALLPNPCAGRTTECFWGLIDDAKHRRNS
jgi:hypothetical protein